MEDINIDLISLVTERTTFTFSASVSREGTSERSREDVLASSFGSLVDGSYRSRGQFGKLLDIVAAESGRADVFVRFANEDIVEDVVVATICRRRFALFFCSRAKEDDVAESSIRLALACKSTISKLASRVSKRTAIASSFVASDDRVSASEGTKESFSRSVVDVFVFIVHVVVFIVFIIFFFFIHAIGSFRVPNNLVSRAEFDE